MTDTQLLAGGGTFCLSCAHLLRIARVAEYCAWCEMPMLDEEAAELQGWAYFADELGELHPCCPGCLDDTIRDRRPVPPPPRAVDPDAARLAPTAAKLTGVPTPGGAENRPFRRRGLF